MQNPNNGLKKRSIFLIFLIIIIVPLIFMILKYDKNEEKLVKVQKKEIVFDGSDEQIYRKDFKSSVKIPFEVRKMIISHDKTKLFALGHDRDGFAVVDISKLSNLKIEKIYYYPKAKYSVEDTDMKESKDGKFLYLVSPNLGVLKFNAKTYEIVGKFSEKFISKITLFDDIAFLKHKDGLFSLNLKTMEKIGEFKTCQSYNFIEKGDILVFDKNTAYMSDFCGLHILDIKNPDKIKEISVAKDKINTPISLKISQDKKTLFENSLDGINKYDLSNPLKPLFLDEYVTNARVYNFHLSNGLILANRNKDGKDDVLVPGLDLLNSDFVVIKSYFMPEARVVDGVILNDEIIFKIDVGFDAFIGTI